MARQRTLGFAAHWRADRTPRFESPPEIPDEAERRWFGGFRWWSVPRIRSSQELVAPRRLAGCLEALLRDGPPGSPVDVGR